MSELARTIPSFVALASADNPFSSIGLDTERCQKTQRLLIITLATRTDALVLHIPSICEPFETPPTQSKSSEIGAFGATLSADAKGLAAGTIWRAPRRLTDWLASERIFKYGVGMDHDRLAIERQLVDASGAPVKLLYARCLKMFVDEWFGSSGSGGRDEMPPRSLAGLMAHFFGVYMNKRAARRGDWYHPSDADLIYAAQDGFASLEAALALIQTVTKRGSIPPPPFSRVALEPPNESLDPPNDPPCAPSKPLDAQRKSLNRPNGPLDDAPCKSLDSSIKSLDASGKSLDAPTKSLDGTCKFPEQSARPNAARATAVAAHRGAACSLSAAEIETHIGVKLDDGGVSKAKTSAGDEHPGLNGEELQALLFVRSCPEAAPLDVARHLYGPGATASRVNPILYALRARGLIDRAADSRPPRWTAMTSPQNSGADAKVGSSAIQNASAAHHHDHDQPGSQAWLKEAPNAKAPLPGAQTVVNRTEAISMVAMEADHDLDAGGWEAMHESESDADRIMAWARDWEKAGSKRGPLPHRLDRFVNMVVSSNVLGGRTRQHLLRAHQAVDLLQRQHRLSLASEPIL